MLRTNKRYILAVVVCLLGISAILSIEQFFDHNIPIRIYLPIHTVLEFTSIVVSFAVFAIGWYGYRQTKNYQDLFIAAAFLSIGIIDLVHTLSYKGMPNFLGVNTTGLAAAYWLSARFVGAIALLGVVAIRPNAKWGSPAVLIMATLAFTFALIGIISAYGPTVSTLMYTPGIGLTLFKKVLEYVVMALYLAAFWLFGRARGWDKDSAHLLRLALLVSVASEICFTQYATPYDAHNLLGHIYKAVAYYFVLQALFVSSLSRPYEALERANNQLQGAFSRIGEALASELQKEPMLKLIASLSRQMLGGDIAAIGEIGHGGNIEIDVFDGIESKPILIPLKGSIIGESLALGRPIIIDDLQTHPKARPEVLSLGVRSFVSTPIVRDGRPAGALYVWSTKPGRFTEDDADILTAFAGHAAIAIGNAEHYEREHHIADALQQAIFPPEDAVYGDFEIAGKYEPAWEEARVGGDFYDYFDLGNGKLGIALGDVSGKGLDAAVHTAIVKYSLLAYLREGFTVSGALARLDESFKDRVAAQIVPSNIFITIFCAVLDLNTGQLTYANAGHEPPMKLSKDGTVDSLEPTGPILGLGVGLPFDEAEVNLAPGDALVVYTDGITESRSAGVLFGWNRLSDVVRGCSSCSSREIADAVYTSAKDYADGLLRDDVALIVIRRAHQQQVDKPAGS